MKRLLIVAAAVTLSSALVAFNQGASSGERPSPNVKQPPSPSATRPANAEPGPSSLRSVDSPSTSPVIRSFTTSSFWGSVDHLFEIYSKGIESADPTQAFLALEALNICLPYAMRQPFFDDAVVRDEGRDAAEVYRTREQLQKACRDFSTVPASTLQQQRHAASTRIRSAGLPINSQDAELSRSPTDREIATAKATLRASLDAGGADALLWLTPAIGGWIEHAVSRDRERVDPALRDTTNIHLAALLSECEMGYDCGPDSVPYLMLCATNGQCGGSFTAMALRGLTDSEQALVRQQAEVIAQAIRRKQWERLGLAIDRSPTPVSPKPGWP